MTDEELKAIEADIGKGYLTQDWRLKHLAPLVAEVRRLRGLIKDAEHAARLASECPWCFELTGDAHAADCPAFTPDGAVR